MRDSRTVLRSVGVGFFDEATVLTKPAAYRSKSSSEFLQSLLDNFDKYYSSLIDLSRQKLKR